MEKNIEKFEKRLGIITVYSLLLALIVMSIVRFFVAAFSGCAMYNIPLLSWYNIVIFAAVALLGIFGTYFAHIKLPEKSKISIMLDRIITNPLTLILLIVLCFRFWYYPYFQRYTAWYDTLSYADYDYNLLLGQVDIFRTPVYPWFIKLIQLITFSEPCSDSLYASVATAQQILSFVGVIIFYFTVKKIFRNKKIISISTVIFGISPYVISWDLCVLTESLSIFSVVLCLFFIVSYLKNPSTKLSVTIGIYILFMVLLRPTFVYMFAIVGVFWIARLILSKTDRKQVLSSIIALALSGCMTLGYCALNKIDNGCFALSNVSTGINKLYMVIDNGIYQSDKYPEISEYIKLRLNSDNPDGINFVTDIIEPLNREFDYEQVSGYVNDCIGRNKDVFVDYTLNKTAGIMELNIAEPYYASYNINITTYDSSDFPTFDSVLTKLLFPFTFAGCLVLVLITVAFCIYQFVKKRLVLWMPLGFAAIIFTHIFVSVYGSMAEFQRLSSMILPAVYLLVFWYVDLAVGGYRYNGFCDELYIRGDRLVRASEKKAAEAEHETEDDSDLLSEAQSIADEINQTYESKEDKSGENEK